MRTKALLGVLAATLSISLAAHGETYPSGPVKIVVPFSAGSSTDIIGREVARVLGTQLHQSFVVENRPGAQATIGGSQVAHARPDGYTLLIGSTTSIAAVPFLLKQIPYKPLTDLLPVARIGAVPFILVARADLGIKTVGELVDYAHKHPGKLNWGYANAANRGAAAMMTHELKMDTAAVPYTGVPQMVIDMLGNRLDFGIIDTTNAAPQIASGKLRALAVTSEDPLPQFPGVPPLGKTVKGYSLLGWYGVYVPAKTPKPVIDTLAKALLKGMDNADYKAHLAHAGLIPYPAGPKELAEFGQSETRKWAQMVKAADIHPQ
jgi:tripartite-type tricarboxylate transporter receptor subunit TctC